MYSDWKAEELGGESSRGGGSESPVRSCGSGTTRPQPQSAGGMPARRADPKALVSFVQLEAGKQQSFTDATNVRMSSRCPTLEFTNNEARSPSEKPGLKIPWRAALVGESRKRCRDYAPEAEPSPLPPVAALRAGRALVRHGDRRATAKRQQRGTITSCPPRPRRPRVDPGPEVTQQRRALPERRRGLRRRKQRGP